MEMTWIKPVVCTAVGIVGGAISSFFGGWDALMRTLIILMVVDYIMGVMVAAVWHKSPKSETGALESRAGWKGLCRKGVTLLIVLVAARLDVMLGTDFVRDAVIIGYAANELISIIENAGLMGIPIPSAIQKAIDILQDKSEEGTDDA